MFRTYIPAYSSIHKHEYISRHGQQTAYFMPATSYCQQLLFKQKTLLVKNSYCPIPHVNGHDSWTNYRLQLAKTCSKYSALHLYKSPTDSNRIRSNLDSLINRPVKIVFIFESNVLLGKSWRGSNSELLLLSNGPFVIPVPYNLSMNVAAR